MFDTVMNLFAMDIENNLCSKVRGKRNYSIRLEHRENENIAYVGTWCGMKKHGLLGTVALSTISEFKIRWFAYTYKKDFMNVINLLEKNNYTICWEQ